jgi:hypothetical protein
MLEGILATAMPFADDRPSGQRISANDATQSTGDHRLAFHRHSEASPCPCPQLTPFL